MRTTVLICGVTVLALGMARGAEAGPDAASRPASERIQVAVDPRVELLCVVFRLAGNPEYNKAPSCPYVREVEEHFGPFKDHAAVQMARILRATHGASYDAVISLAVHVEDAVSLKERVPFDPQPERLDGRWSANNARPFLEQVRAFAKDTKFDSFVAAHQALYTEAAERLRRKLGERDYLAWFDEFFGARPGATFHAVPGLLTGPNCYGAGIRLADRAEEIYQVMGVWAHDADGVPVFGDDIRGTVVHEFCHAYVNAVVDRQAAALRAAGEVIFPHVREAMAKQAYGNWLTTVKESCVRACVVRHLLKVEGKAAADAETKRQHARQFVWMEELVRLLDDYEGERGRYPTFEAFFPRIVEFFNEYAKRDLGEAARGGAYGPINRVIEACKDGNAAVVVMPEVTGDDAAAKKVQAFVSAIHKRFYAAGNVPLLSAGQVTEEMLRTRNLVLYGSPASNAVLRGVAEKCGMKFAAEGIEFGGKGFPGAGLVLIACLPNPYNAERSVLVYASAKDENVIEANSFFHGPTDYVVGRWSAERKAEVVRQGDFKRGEDGKWAIAE